MSLDPALLWPAVAAPFLTLAWELPHATNVALKSQKKKKKKKKKKKERKKEKKSQWEIGYN